MFKLYAGARSSLHAAHRRLLLTRDTDTITTIIAVLLALLAIVIIGVVFVFIMLWPIWLAWAINNMFGTSIPLTFVTWISTLIIIGGVKFVIHTLRN